jgi:ABC-type sulfate transport system substrate-binding protein
MADPPVTLVDENCKAKGNTKVAEAYLQFLYSPEGQKLAAKHYFRPSDPTSADPADLARFQKLDLVNIDDDFGGWSKAQATHFADGGIFDQIYKPSN